MFSEPRHYAILLRIAAIAVWLTCWLLGYSEVITSIWVATNWVASIICDAFQLVWERLPPIDPPEQSQREQPRRPIPLRRILIARRDGERGH